MANCPNCGRSTAKTKDWCCQWCGYPLFSGAFKTINKTYKELKAERLALLSVEEEKKGKSSQKPAEGKIAENINKVEQHTKTEKKELESGREVVVEQPAPEDIPVSKPEPAVEIRQIRKERYESTTPVRRRIIRRHRRAPASEPEVVEYVEYIDEPEEDTEEYFEEYEEESGTEEGSSSFEDEYEEVNPRVISRPVPETRPVRKVKPVERFESVRPVNQDMLSKHQPVNTIEPETNEIDEHIEEPVDGIKANNNVNEAKPEDNTVVISKAAENNNMISEKSESKTVDESGLKDNVIKLPESQKTHVPVQALMEITVDELISAYETAGPDADARFANKFIKITGLVGKIDIKEAASVYALVLEAPGSNPLRQSVRCVFSREHRDTLQKTFKGQTVSVQGKYDGSIINISMRDCLVV
jgi:hypothetical protein